MRTHVAYNLATGEVITSKCRGNSFKRLIAHHTATEIKTDIILGVASNYRWLFAHGESFDDCVAKLRARRVWG
jgi:hypothetical protein